MTIQPRPRQAFTLTELMVSLAIIALIVSMTAGAIFQYIAVSQKMATESTIRKLYSRLNAQWAAVIDTARREQMDTVLPSNPGTGNPGPMDEILALSNGDVNLTRAIYIKFRLRQEFPMAMSELISTNPPYIPPKSAYLNLPSGIAGQNYESSALLLAALRQTRQGISLSPDDLGSSVKTVTVGTSTVQYAVDGWGQPLNFYRWPTGCAELDGLCPITTGSHARDTQDPDGRLLSLQNTAPQTASAQGMFESWCHLLHRSVDTNAIPPITSASAFYEFYTVPVIASSGPDLQFGLTNTPNGPMSRDGTNSDTDNIYSFRLVPPGARGN